MPIINKIVKLGKLPAQIPHNLKLMSAHFAGGLPPAPESYAWSKDQKQWGMMANDKLGDCTCAAVGHAYQVWTLNERGKEWTAPDKKIVQLYADATGYSPKKLDSDNGALCSDILKYITKNTFCGWTIDGYGLVRHSDINAVKQAMWLFGGVYIGIALPIRAQNQEIWDVGMTEYNMEGDGEPNSWGGHCVQAVDYDVTGVTVITWGALQKMTWEFWTAYVDESYAVLSNAWVMAGRSPPGFDKEALRANMNELIA